MFSLNLPSIKRIPGDFETFHEAVEQVGFEHQSSSANGRVHYHENEVGMGVTVIDGPRANILAPAGPIRGRLFKRDVSAFSDSTSIKELMDEIEAGEGNNSREGERGRRNEFSV